MHHVTYKNRTNGKTYHVHILEDIIIKILYQPEYNQEKETTQ